MVNKLEVSNLQSSLAKAYTCLNYLTCYHCQHYFTNPITLPCGHSICSACLSPGDNQFVKLQPSLITHCPFPKCCSSNVDVSTIQVDVTLSKILQACLKGYDQLQFQLHQDKVTSSLSTDFLENIQSEFECHICYMVLYEPITTACGHTFCKECILRTIDHSNNCPTCRSTLTFSQVCDRSTNHIIRHLTETFFSESLLKRAEHSQKEVDIYESVPILVGGLAFPLISYSLHIFEPSYRLMIRRCLETERKQFGMVSRNNSGALSEYGTLVQIKSAQSLPDGRFLIQVEGLNRFKISNHSNQEGYYEAKIELIEDDISLSEKDVEENSVEEMMQAVKDFVDSLGKGYPQLLAQLKQLYGPTPQALIPFSYWASCVIPINDQEKYKLLCIDDARIRLSMIVRWIESARKQWGFVSCSVM
ncbi:hypothetical protein K7432_003693 [Basidiobolus ranarum]|uniref:Uncharacterized protein n=1 Tax=Basidiobolus ranarum TaxID=34480 RepID=A0ABR2W6P7_9FUNG